MTHLKNKLGFALLVASLGAQTAQSQNLILRPPLMSGNGCSAADSNVILSPNQSTLSVLFSNFTISAGPDSGRRNGRSLCHIRIPVKVPEGYSLSVFKVDYRGFVNLPHNFAQAKLSTKNGLVDFSRIPKGALVDTKLFQGPYEDNFFVSQTLKKAWSTACGAETEIQMETELLVTNIPRMGQRGTAEITLDSVDSQAGLTYKILLTACPR